MADIVNSEGLIEVSEKDLDELGPQEAFSHLVKILGFEEFDDPNWGDIVYYTAKAKSSLRMSNAAIRRRMMLLRDELDMPEQAVWPQIIEKIRQIMEERRDDGPA